jgi:predicted GIY-YIG superfamily endonuclease
MAFVYFIQSTNGSTYIGATVNLDKRIRQHNKEIAGGAVATSIRVSNGEAWSYICYVENFPSYNEALKFEWRWKQISRQIQKENRKILPYDKRINALTKLLSLDKSTTRAIPYNQWEKPPNVVYVK